ncbi:putative glycosyl hydrolase [Escovopsis weberi]|uniref:Putative glycosyl hydrolase n=1 Tax=Escovopsis weberi TaxID=150374 RepID=A0A0M8N1C6_ESCWE|nr:putative glycosyl hydrolase [Escovopsis weberi]
MASFRLTIDNGQFRDGHGRQVVLRGINVAGDSKLPSEPDQPSHSGTDFFNGNDVSFHQRPFTKEDAPIHFARIKRFGFNTIRYVFTWEAIEAAGPRIYDEQFIQHTIEVLRIAKSYGFYIFMDPHQDVWSRFTGGSGAPLWTIYACGLNPQSLAVTEAAVVHNTYSEPDKFPRMIWSTNYYRLATGTIFTMFFGGRHFAPKCIIDGVNIQDYLQSHFIDAVAHLARRIHEAGDLENEVVVGWESLNEPNKCMIGYADLTVIPKEHPLKKGTCPTMWQTYLTGMGIACEIETWDMGGLGPYKTGSRLVDPHGETAWLPEGFDDTAYGWKRDPGWKLGQCVWAQHGVWDIASETMLKKDYFAKNPETGATIDYPTFTNTYFMDFYRRYRDACRSIHRDCIMLMQWPILELPPEIKGTEDDDPKMAFTPHYYDGITLMTKHWNSTWNVDVVGVLRGKYWHPAFAIRIGETAIRNCFRDQMATLRQEGLDRTGNHPCLMSEFGIPFDMDDKKAYKDRNYASQIAALDASYYGVEGSGIEGHCLWLYSPSNTHERGDRWNGEDLSIISQDDKIPPLLPTPRDAAADSSTNLVNEAASAIGASDDDASITPGNLQRTLTNPLISSAPTAGDPELTNAPGYRAAEAFIRPTATVVAGNVKSAGFDLRNCSYRLVVVASKPASEDAPTVVYLPEFHFPESEFEVALSGGKFEVVRDEDEAGPPLQRLRWWNPKGEQTLTVKGPIRKHQAVEGTAEDSGYLEQCIRGYGWNCSVM